MGEGLRLAKIIDLVDDKAKGHKGISFYCSKRHEYVFIENSNNQNSGKVYSKHNTKNTPGHTTK